MANLLELKKLFGHSDLQDRVQAALIIAVQATLSGTPTEPQMKYAAHVFSNPKGEGDKALMSVLAANNTATVAQITGASQSAIQTNVDDVISTLSAAFNAA